MNDKTAALLACPLCHRSLRAERIRRRAGEVVSGTLVCEACALEFPIVLGRPLLVPPGVPQRWMTAMDEAVGWDGEPRNLERILAWLAEAGVEKAIRCVRAVERPSWHRVPNAAEGRVRAVSVSNQLLNRARYITSGRWFRTVRTNIRISDGVHPRSWALECPGDPVPDDPQERSLLDELVFQVRRLQPRRLLDIASGGGFCVSRLVAHLEELEIAIATDRALDDCIWVTQYKLDYLGAGDRAGAIAADVRSLPLHAEAFDVATCFYALFEIHGVTRMLDEVHRVLLPGGRFAMAQHCRCPLFGVPLPEGLPPGEFCRFLEAADLHHAGLDQFRARVWAAGFQIEAEYCREDAGETFVGVLRKGDRV